MSGLEDVLGAGDAAKQLFLWAVLNQVVTTLMGPYFEALQNKVQAATPVVPMSPADAAHAVVRSYMDDADGQAAAAQSGVSASVFEILKDLAGTAPSPEQLTEALRRGTIDRSGAGAASTSFEQGIKETNLLDKWQDVVAGLAQQWPSPADALRAALQGQVPEDQGQALYEKWGGDPQWYQIMFDSEGSAPTPVEAGEMALRGIIPWDGTGPQAVSYQQAFLEGPWRNKWADPFRQLASYWLTPSEIIEFYRYAVIDQPTAAAMLAGRGVAASDAALYLAYADANAIDDYRGLTEQAVLAMVSAGYTTDAQAKVMLKALHKGDAAIDQLITYAGLQRQITALGNAVDRIGNLYQGRKIDAATATQALNNLHLPAESVAPLIADWDAVASVNVKTLTETQIVDAAAAAIITVDEAMTELGSIGYTPFDSWLLLSIKAKAPLPGKPAQGPGPPLGAPKVSTT